MLKPKLPLRAVPRNESEALGMRVMSAGVNCDKSYYYNYSRLMVEDRTFARVCFKCYVVNAPNSPACNGCGLPFGRVYPDGEFKPCAT